MKREYLSVNEVASQLGISRAAIYSAIREGRLESEVVLGRIAVKRSSAATYKPNQDRIRAGKIRPLQNPCVVIETPKTPQRLAGEKLLNFEALAVAHYTLRASHSIHLEFTDGSTDTFDGNACDAILRDLTERTNIIEISRESGADLINVNWISKATFSFKSPNALAVIKIWVLVGKSREMPFSGSEAEVAWQELKRILKPTVLATKRTRTVPRTGTKG